MNQSFDKTPIFKAQDLCFSYNNQVSALDHISLSIKPGERLALLGSNGSGKSTLLKILDGLFFPNRGSIQAFGRPLTEQALRDDRFNFEFRSRVGFVFQDSDAQLFMPSVWDEIAFAPLQLGVDHSEVAARVEAALIALQIEKLRDRSPHQLSEGEKKKVSLASVLSLSPEVWLLDEPSAGLDPRSVSWLINFINSQANIGKTIVLATNDLDIAKTFANRVYILDENHHMIFDGTPDDILSNQKFLIEANLARCR